MRYKGLITVVLLSFFAISVYAAPGGGTLKVTAVKGKVVIKTANGFERTAYQGLSLHEGDMIKTYRGGTAEITAPTGDTVTILELSALTIDQAQFTPAKSIQSMSMDIGKMYSTVNKLKKNSVFAVATPFATAGVRGTLFSVQSTGDKSVYRCLQGTLRIEKLGRVYTLNEGEELEEDMNGVVGPSPISSESLEEFQKELEQIQRSTGNQGYLKQAVESVQKIAASRPGEKLGRPFQEPDQQEPEKIEPKSVEKSDKPTSGGGVKQTSTPPKKTKSSYEEAEGTVEIFVRAQASITFEGEEEEEEEEEEKKENLAEELFGEEEEEPAKTAQAQPGDRGGVDDPDKPGKGPETMEGTTGAEQGQGAGLEDDKPGRDRDPAVEESVATGVKDSSPTESEPTESEATESEATESTPTEITTTEPTTTVVAQAPVEETTATTPEEETTTTNEQLAESMATDLPISGGEIFIDPVTIAVVEVVVTETSNAGNPGN